ncbi:hypothetical protein Esti_000977 [Eimeria stiedai]
MLKSLSPWGGVLAFVAARRLARTSTVESAASSKTTPRMTTEGEDVEKAEVQAQSRRALRSERRRLQAELRERAQVELAKVRAARNQACRNPSQLQPGVGHATFSSASLAEKKQQSQRAAVTASTKQNLHLQEKRDTTQRPQLVEKPGLGIKLHALFSLIRMTVDSDSSSSDSSQDDEEPTIPRRLVAPPQAVQRRSCMKVQTPSKERALTRLTSRVDWSPVVEAAKFCKAEPTVICIVRDKDGVLKQPAPLLV